MNIINPSVNLQAAVMSFHNVMMAIKTNGLDNDDVEASMSQMKRSTEEIFFSSYCCYMICLLFAVHFFSNKFISQMKC